MFIEVKRKSNGKYEVIPNSSPMDTTLKGAAISSYETAFCFLNVTETPYFPKRGAQYSSSVPTSEDFEIWTSYDNFEVTYDILNKSLFAGRSDSLMLTDGYSGYALMKIGDKFYAVEPGSDAFTEGFEVTMDSSLEIPIVTNAGGTPYPPNQVSTITNTDRIHVRYNGSNKAFYSITEYSFETASPDSEYYPPDAGNYQYVTVGTLDVNNRKINFARYVFEGI